MKAKEGHEAISYLEGYQEGEKVGLEVKCLETYELGYREGIRKVVDWISETFCEREAIYLIYPEDWQAKLKEWGITPC